MTTLISLATSAQGIVMGADRKITIRQDNKIVTVGDRDKIIILENEKIGISYWGLATIGDEKTIDIINKIYSEIEKPATVDSLAEKIKDFLIKFNIDKRVGFHICGYQNKRPKVRHVFHESYHKLGEVCNEDANIEFHDQKGRRIPHDRKEKYQDVILFSGDNDLSQLFFSKLPMMGEHLRLGFRDISGMISLIKLIISITIYMQNFMIGYERLGHTTGNGLDIITITENEIKRIESNTKKISFSID